MNERDELLRRVTMANPVPHTADLPDSVVEGRPPVGLLINDGGTREPDTRSRHSGRADRRWRGPVLAFGTAAALFAVVAVSLLLVGGDRFDAAEETTAAPVTTTTAVGADSVRTDVWSASLATTTAGTAPATADCPPGTDPSMPGPIDQVRPGEGPWNNQAAVFDTHAGRIVYLDETGGTWTFDVCTNTWHAMNPEGTPYGDWRVSRAFGDLVYDVDSDRTVAFGRYYVSVYDANTNTWTQRSPDPEIDLESGWVAGAVYDPVSGLVVLQTDNGLVTYDVDTDAWTPLGQLWCSPNMVYDADSQQWSPADPVPGCTPFLVGYSADTDRMFFLGFQDDGLAVDPRTGDSTHLVAPDGGVMGGFGSFRYATGGETAYTYGGRGVCRLDPATLSWDCSAASQQEAMPSAMVYDPINSRVVVINDFCCTWPGSTVSDDVWAIDFDTHERIGLLATANTRIEEDGS